jgi:hypothetical protein
MVLAGRAPTAYLLMWGRHFNITQNLRSFKNFVSLTFKRRVCEILNSLQQHSLTASMSRLLKLSYSKYQENL